MDTATEPKLKTAGAMVRALEGLKGLIASGKLSPGEQIRQEEMAEQMSVSRVPLREALNVLANQGLLNHKPNQGYFVVKRTQAEREQLSRMLHLLENELVTSVEWPDAAVLERLRDLNAQMQAAVRDEDVWRLLQVNRQFHFEIFSLSPHRLILEEVQRLWVLVEPVLWAKFARAQAREQTLVEHERLIAALEAHDLSLYASEMHNHRYPARDGAEG